MCVELITMELVSGVCGADHSGAGVWCVWSKGSPSGPVVSDASPRLEYRGLRGAP